MKIQEVLSAPRSPWQRAYVERVIGSIRRECLDHVIVFNEAGLRLLGEAKLGAISGARAVPMSQRRGGGPEDPSAGTRYVL